jgi:ATP-dependent DNA ligase
MKPPVDPMLAQPVSRLPRPGALRGGAAYEPKYDGYRALIFVEGDRIFVQSRRGKDITGSFPEIASAAAEQLPTGTVVDGELVVLVDGVLDFAALQRRLVTARRARTLAVDLPAHFVAFDLLAADGEDIRALPFRERRAALEALPLPASGTLLLVPQTRDAAEAERWLEQYADASVGLEGIVAKGLADSYESGRRGWQKVRVRDTVDVIVAAVTGALEAPDRLILGLRDESGTLVVAGGTAPLSRRQREEVLPLLKEPGSPHPWPRELPQGRMGHFGGGKVEVTLVEPFVAEVSADRSFEHGKWRHVTRFVRTRPDLQPGDLAHPG